MRHRLNLTCAVMLSAVLWAQGQARADEPEPTSPAVMSATGQDAEPQQERDASISFEDADTALSARNGSIVFSQQAHAARRYAPFGDERPEDALAFGFRLSADGADNPLGLDVSVAQRARVSSNASGDVAGASNGSELRVGRGLANPARNNAEPSWYMFAASDDEALTLELGGSRSGGDGVALRDRVEIGDRQAGITYESGSVQASLAYVEREVSVQTGVNSSLSRSENFAGVTLTMKH